MRFEHPELLYALLLLVIPIIVHLFRLRRFQKEDFTNVKFLKKVIQETRKSSRLKKFLLLFSRLLLITCLVFAFAKPFVPASNNALKKSETLIYLDNSYSMQAPGEQSSLFQQAKDQLIENLDRNLEYTLFTNDENFENKTGAELILELQNLELSAKQLDFRQINLRAKRFFEDKYNSNNQFVIISDFQKKIGLPSSSTQNFELNFIKNEAKTIQNLSIDSAYISEIDPENFKLKILLSGTSNSEDAMISVYDGENLLGRNSAKLNEGLGSVNFRLQNKEIKEGIIRLEDNGLTYDDELFFSKQKNTSINVVAISSSKADFLRKIYTEPEFKLKVFEPGQIDYNALTQANLIVLNEVSELTTSLMSNVGKEIENGSSLIIIPPIALNSQYLRTLKRFGVPQNFEAINTERLITSINFDHPLLQQVFEERIQNFEYPNALRSYNLKLGNAVLKYQDGQAFLSQSGSTYLFSAALNLENSNFTNSPLIVPVLYQIGLKSLKTNALYYSSDKEELIDVPVKISGDQVLHLENKSFNVIPQQQNFSKKTEIRTIPNFLRAGNYRVTSDEKVLGTISFNDSRAESELSYLDLSKIEEATVFDTIQDYFSQTKASSQITPLWKWFVIFALIFLAIEMLLIKFLK